ncbi:fumarylacetoacetate hydrolase family protein [Cellulosimicrobium funkei]|nr:fumarylacetoacetate hydrolase family protein [Cellulosimicrobium funkei]
MHLCTIIDQSGERPAVVLPDKGVAQIGDLFPGFEGDVLEILVKGRLEELRAAAKTAPRSVFADPGGIRYGAPYRHPRMLWGIGLNYVEHASDLTTAVPDEPASFVKGDHTIIGPGEDITIPVQSQRTTAEAEIGLVIGRYCRDVSEEEALSYVVGVVPILDQTAEDILERNPRFLTRSKNFPGFFSFGPRIVPISEVLQDDGTLGGINVSTVINGKVHRENTVSNMRYSPEFLVSFHSRVMPLYPGDIISTGTPGAVHVRAGDVVESRIPAVGTLSNPVVDQR